VFLDNIFLEKPVFDVVSPTNKLNYYLKGQKSSDAHLILINGDTAMLITDTEWIDTITLNPETNLIQVRAKDDFNNYSDTVEKIIFLDNIAPPIPTVFYTTPYNKENQSINGTFDTQATSILRINSKPASMNFELGTWIGSVDLNNEDTNLISILAFDAAGNSSETSFVIFRDMTGPEQPKILSPVNNYKTSLYNITLSGTKPVESYVYINDILAENNDYNDTTWSTNYNMLAGFNLIRAVAKDSLGNMSEADQIVVDFDVNFFLAEIPELENTEYIYPKDFLKINLNKPINLETNNNANIYFVDISGNYDYADSLIYNSIDYSIKVIKNLLPSRSYRFIVSKNVKDENNNSLTQSLFYQFKTLIPKLTNLNIGFDNSNFTISFLNSTLLKDAFFEVTNLDLSNEKVLLADNKINFDGFKKDLGVNRKIYEVTGNYNDGETITTFAAPPVLSIKYKDLNSDGILDNTNIKSENLSIYYLNEINNVWEKIDDCDIDFSQKVVSSTISKNGIYTMFSGHFDYDTTTFVYYQNGKPKLSIYSPKNNNIYFDITELKVNDNYSLKTADDKLLSKNGFLKDMEGARILFRITPRNENDEYVQNLNDNIIIYFSWLDENNDNIVDNTVIEEKYLKLYKFDEINEVWNEIQGTIDSVNNRIFVNTNKCSIFTVFGSKFETGDFWFYPNPTLTKKINLFVAPLTDNILNLKIVNPFGRAVYSKSFNIVPGQANYIKDIDLKKLPFGGYYGKISFDGKTHITGIGIAK
jgi:hypothetical protein